MSAKKLGKLAIIILVVGLIWAFDQYGLGQYFTLSYLKESQSNFAEYFAQNTLLTISIYVGVYVAMAALSLPGATVMTLAGGALFGLGLGTALVSVGSTLGATCAFLASRFLLRDSIESKFSEKLKAINQGVEKDGAFYLFTLRLIPVFPFFVINLVMGLTKIRTLTFFFVSQIGMLPGTFVYVNAGTELSKIESLSGILSPGVLFSFVLLGLFPLVAKKLVDGIKANKVLKKYKHLKPKKYDYNMVVIGAGAAGLVSSYIAAAVKAKVVLIEKHAMGGDCLNTGCVPSKALIKSAKIMSYAKRAKDFGFKSANIEYDFADVMERVQTVIKKIEPHDSVERYTGLGVECIQGEAKIASPYTVEVNGRTLTTRAIIVATGARPFVPPIPGLESVNFLTSDTIWNLRQQPQKLVVLGGGPIGSELTQAFARLGTEVTQVEKSDRIMQREDPDVSETIEKRFKDEGIRVLTGHNAIEVKPGLLICEDSQGNRVEVEFDQILLAIGRKANVTGFGLEELGVRIHERGTIDTDEFLRTNYPNIFVCGDVAGPYQFTHTAAHQAWFAAVNAMFPKKFKVDYRVIPWCTFTDPEVARVGMNETEAKESGIDYEVTTYGIDDLDRAIADSEDHGFIKVITPKGKDTILGATIVGDHGGEIIAEYVAAMKHGFGLNKILGTIHIYPTLAETNKYVAGNWKKAHKPEGALRWVERYHAWKRNQINFLGFLTGADPSVDSAPSTQSN